MPDDEDRKTIRERARTLAATEHEFMATLTGLRHTHGLTQTQVAERMGVSQPAIARLERHDANPTLSTVRRYALAVGALTVMTAHPDPLFTHGSPIQDGPPMTG